MVGCRYDHPHILAGQGTMGLEIVEQVPDVDAVLVPVGGGGLIAGTALAVKSLHPHIKVYVGISVLISRCLQFEDDFFRDMNSIWPFCK
jgi:threonine dehydratase